MERAGSPVNQRRQRDHTAAAAVCLSVCPCKLHRPAVHQAVAGPETQGIMAPVSFTCRVGNKTQGKPSATEPHLLGNTDNSVN